MAKQLSLVALALIAASAFVGVNSTSFSKPLDCSAVTQVESMRGYNLTTCGFVADKTEEQFAVIAEEYSLLNRLDMLEICTCNVLRHEIVWRSLMTHEREILFLAAKKLVQQLAPKADDKTAPSKALMNEIGDKDEHMYFWDYLNNILRKYKDSNSGLSEVSDTLMSHFSENYYSPDTMTMGTRGAIMLVQRSCHSLFRDFDIFLVYFVNLRTLAKNDRFVYQAVSHNFDLYKLLANMKVCQFLDVAGYLPFK